MLDKHNQSSPRIIENAKCLSLVKFKGDIYRVVGSRGPNRNETDLCYFDLWLDNGEAYKGPDIVDVALSETQTIDIEPRETKAVFGSNNGWARPMIVVENNV